MARRWSRTSTSSDASWQDQWAHAFGVGATARRRRRPPCSADGTPVEIHPASMMTRDHDQGTYNIGLLGQLRGALSWHHSMAGSELTAANLRRGPLPLRRREARSTDGCSNRSWCRPAAPPVSGAPARAGTSWIGTRTRAAPRTSLQQRMLKACAWRRLDGEAFPAWRSPIDPTGGRPDRHRHAVHRRSRRPISRGTRTARGMPVQHARSTAFSSQKRDDVLAQLHLTDRMAIITGGTRGIGRGGSRGWPSAPTWWSRPARRTHCAETKRRSSWPGANGLGVATHLGDISKPPNAWSWRPSTASAASTSSLTTW